jgi:26S proteasome regulatory subunit N12
MKQNSTATELLLARDILQIGAEWSIAVKDIPSFIRHMAQLKCYYLNMRVSYMPSNTTVILFGVYFIMATCFGALLGHHQAILEVYTVIVNLFTFLL